MTADFLKKQFAIYLLKQHFFVEEDKIFLQKLNALQPDETIDYSYLSDKFINFLINEAVLAETVLQDLIREELICMPYEKIINHLKNIKNQLNERHNKKQIFYCGIKAIDQMVLGFQHDKTYTILFQKREIAKIFFNNLKENLSLVYGNKFLNYLKLANPKQLRVEAILSKPLNLYYLPNSMAKDSSVSQNFLLENLPKAIENHSNVVIFFYHAEEETPKKEGVESSLEIIIEFKFLKNDKHILGTDKLVINSSQQLQSIKSTSFLNKFMRKMNGLL